MSHLDTQQLSDINVLSQKLLPTPFELKSQIPLSDKATKTVFAVRNTLQNILDRKDSRLFFVIGPCSIHDLKAGKEYAERLKKLADKVQDEFLIIMRVYFSKPRTTVGWKGFINDPYLDDSFCIAEGLAQARSFLLEVSELGLGIGTEALDPIIPQYIDDLISWNAIGARTTESQTHREMASGLSTPVGFKNGTDGSVEVAINALKAVSTSHHFLGINQHGQCAVLETRGNPYGHLVLRGGIRPNYDAASIGICEKELRNAKLPVNIVVDCSHGNSSKDPALQPLALSKSMSQIVQGNRSIVGIMLESNLSWGNQSIVDDLSKLTYGVSVTDACIDWATTERIVLEAREKVGAFLMNR